LGFQVILFSFLGSPCNLCATAIEPFCDVLRLFPNICYLTFSTPILTTHFIKNIRINFYFNYIVVDCIIYFKYIFAIFIF
jgi:hypothetical protein